MVSKQKSWRKNGVTLAVGGVVLALTMAACGASAGETGAGVEGESFEYGASVEETRAAFVDMEPVTLTFQTGATSTTTTLGQAYGHFADQVYEWSDGKVQIDISPAGTIVPLTEVDDALADGRLDLGQLTFSYQPQEYPIANNMTEASILSTITPLTGEIAQYLSMLQLSVDTPELYEEMSSHDLTPLLPLAIYGSTGMACTEPIESLEDLEGRLIATGSTTSAAQVEALGGSATSVEYTEIYEAMQRGVVDCNLSNLPVYDGVGLTEIAPHFYLPEGANFQAGPTSLVAGSSWDSLPLPVRQLVYDKLYEWFRDSTHVALQYVDSTNQALEDTAGGIEFFDPSVSEALSAANEDILAEEMEYELYDAADFAERYAEANEYWREQVEAAGYTDDGEWSDFGDWYQGDLSSSVAADYLAPLYDEAFEEVAGQGRPE